MMRWRDLIEGPEDVALVMFLLAVATIALYLLLSPAIVPGIMP